MESLESSVFGVKMDSSLISLLEVVADVQERGASEGIAKVTNLGISWNEASEPIIGNTDCWNFLSLATILKACLAEDCNLVYCKVWLRIWVRARVEVRVVQEYDLHTLDSTLVDSDGASASDVNVHVVDVPDASGISLEVTSMALSVPLVVW